MRPEIKGLSLSRKKAYFYLFIFYFLLFNIIGCEAFVRKFTRKSKKADQTVEMVLEPQEYTAAQLSKEELYRQYFLYWKSWHDELLNALAYKASGKKQIDCAQEAMKNLVNMSRLLNEDKRRKLEMYISKLEGLLDAIKGDVYGDRNAANFQAAEKLKNNIMRDFTYPKIKNYML